MINLDNLYLKLDIFFKFLVNNSFSIFLFLSFIMIFYFFYKISFSLKNKFLFFLFVLPGTLMHELAHLIIGVFLNAKPTKFSLIPKKDSNGSYTLGSVSFTNISFYNSIFVGMAPLVLFPLSFYFSAKSFYYIDTFLKYSSNYNLLSLAILNSYLAFVSLVSFIPSRQDFKVAFFSKEGFLGILFYSFLFYIIYYIFL